VVVARLSKVLVSKCFFRDGLARGWISTDNAGGENVELAPESLAGPSGYLLMREPGKLIIAPDIHKLGSRG
jgi:hypothetical protein